jgi:hypothetical protein
MDLIWRPHFPTGESSIWYLLRGTDELARVAKRVDGAGWLSEVGRHRRDWTKRPQRVAPTRETAMRWAMAWTRANLSRILESEIAPLVRTACGTLSTAPEIYGARVGILLGHAGAKTDAAGDAPGRC